MGYCNYIHRVAGNSFSNMPASPPPIVMPPEHPTNPQGPVSAPTSPEILIDQDKKQGTHTGPLVGIAVGSIAAASCVLFMLVFCLHNSRKKSDDGNSEPKDILSSAEVNPERGMPIFLFPLLFLHCSAPLSHDIIFILY
jgi:hypothetical protein